MSTQRDVAKAADVSIATVSRFINSKGYISVRLKKRIGTAIRELQYKPNLVARGLKIRKSSIIGLVFPDIQNSFFVKLITRAEEVAQRHRYNIILCNTQNNPQKEIEYVEMLKGRQVDGYLIIPSITIHSRLGDMLRGESVVFLDRMIGNNHEHIVVKLDNVKGMKLAVGHLVALGHTRIGMIAVPTNVTTGQERVEGYRLALAQNNIRFNERLVAYADFSIDNAYESTKRLLSHRSRPTALLPISGPTTAGALKAVRELGLAIPDDVSIIGFDEFDYAELLTPALSTIAQPESDFGVVGIGLLLKEMQGKNIKERTVVLPPRLIERSSCRRLG
jgi:LacI family transcriptional regulator